MRTWIHYRLLLGVAVVAAIVTAGVILALRRNERLPRPVEKPPLPDPKIVIWKSKRQLRLYSGESEIRSYRIGLGFSPVGDKVKQGDGRTPEGEFYVSSKNPRSRFYLALGLSYPNEEDAQRGLRDGLISQGQHDRIVDAIRKKRQPPWDTPLGGAILIHGHGAHGDWTLGCIALDNDDMRDLYECVPVGSPVEILP